MKQYTPESYFFTEYSKLSDIAAENSGTDAFGPVVGSETTKYRVTSFVNSSDKKALVKLFAICEGSLLIQSSQDPEKINIILKPARSYSPLKIKYFIYRGVNKADYFTDDALNKPDPDNADQPETLRKMWEAFIAFNGLSNITGVFFPLDYIYQLDAPVDRHIDEAFQSSLINCKAGEHIGNFKGKVGLDIVLDYGDYELENQEDDLFRLNLKFAQAKDFIFDTSSATNPVKQKRYKEHIHQFLDAAAFWGSHIDCGTIILNDGSKYKNTSDISKLLGKYQTANKIYIYIQGENNRSFNYYDTNRKIELLSGTSETCETSSWPILIKSYSESVMPKNIKLPIDIDGGIKNNVERHVSVNLIDPTKDMALYPMVYSPKGTKLGKRGKSFTWSIPKEFNIPDYSFALFKISNGVLPDGLSISANKKEITGTPTKDGLFEFEIQITYSDGKLDTKNISINISTGIDVPLTFKTYKNATDTEKKTCSGFIFFFCNLIQKFPIENYFNHLWVPNIKSSLVINPDKTKMYWATYDKSRNVNFEDTIGEAAIIQNKVIFDEGKTNKRRTFAAVIKDNSGQSEELRQLNIDKICSGYVGENESPEIYFLNFFNDANFSIYKGTFTDTDDGKTVDSLCLFHTESMFKKNALLLLGITEDEYRRFTIPAGADNLFFNLEEVTTFTSENVRKFKLGLRYEESNGIMSDTVFYPSSGDIYVYSIDDLFFFSKEYSDYQEFYKEFANAKVEFRTIMDQKNSDYSFNPPTNISTSIPFYKGEFGFDWLRIGDNGEPAYGNNGVIVNGYERPSSNDDDLNDTEYKDYKEAYKFLKRKYFSLPTLEKDDQYYIPYLNLFSKSYANRSTNNPKPPFEATLRILVKLEESLNKLEFDYDKNLFTINKQILSDKNASSPVEKKESQDKTITITCLKDFAEMKQIRVLAYPRGVNDKSKAKLAGLIIVNKNNNIQNANVVLVKIQTNVGNTLPFEQGWFTFSEKANLYKALYQCLLNPNIIEESAYYELDSNSNFKPGGIYIDGTAAPFYIKYQQLGLQDFLRNNFLTLNTKYNDYFTIFSFDLSPRPDSSSGNVVVGNVQDIGIHNVNLFSLRNDMTLSHETMHGYGLYHTHRDGTAVINEPDRKFIYVHAYNPTPPNVLNATDNYMSYNGDKRKTIWKWQMKIITNNLK